MKRAIIIAALVAAFAGGALAGASQHAERFLTAIGFEEAAISGMEEAMEIAIREGQVATHIARAMAIEMRRPHRMRELRQIAVKTLEEVHTESCLKGAADFFESKAGQEWLRLEAKRLRALETAGHDWGFSVGQDVGRRYAE